MAKDAKTKKRVEQTSLPDSTPASAPKPSKRSQKADELAILEKAKKPEVEAESGEEPGEGDEEDDEEGDESSEDEEDVDEAGMAKLMAALGEDGLDEFAQVELRVLAGEEEDGDSEDGEENSGAEAGVEDHEDVSPGEEVEEDGEDEGDEEEDDEEAEEDEESEEEQEEEQDVALDDVESVDDDVVPRQKLEIDNKIALERIRDTIKLDPSMPWTETLTVTFSESIDVDVDDDLNRELAFYKQALHGANTAKSLAAKHNLPFTRPTDYFAEMVKSDAHMERIRQRLLDEGASIKRSEDKRKEREGKKFGKQVQMEKLKEREKSKKDMEERLKGLKRKRKGALDNAQEGGDDFDVAVEDAIADRPSKRVRGAGPGGKRGGLSRNARDNKFGFGGSGKRAKQNTKDSTDDFGGGRGERGRGGSRGGSRGGRSGRGGSSGGRGGRGGAKPSRPGKGRRMKARS